MSAVPYTDLLHVDGAFHEALEFVPEPFPTEGPNAEVRAVAWLARYDHLGVPCPDLVLVVNRWADRFVRVFLTLPPAKVRPAISLACRSPEPVGYAAELLRLAANGAAIWLCSQATDDAGRRAYSEIHWQLARNLYVWVRTSPERFAETRDALSSAWRLFHAALTPAVLGAGGATADGNPDTASRPSGGQPSHCAGRLQFDDQTHTVMLDGIRIKVDHAPTYNAFRFIAEGEGQLVTTKEIRSRVRACAGRLDDQFREHLPHQLRRILKGKRGHGGGYHLEFPEETRNDAQSTCKGA
jgi:hypothetical protein